MKAVILLMLCVVVVGCSSKAKNAGNGKGQTFRGYSDEYRFNDDTAKCTTDTQTFTADSEYQLKQAICKALQDEERNNSCALVQRQDYFQKKCIDMQWTGATVLGTAKHTTEKTEAGRPDRKGVVLEESAACGTPPELQPAQGEKQVKVEELKREAGVWRLVETEVFSEIARSETPNDTKVIRAENKIEPAEKTLAIDSLNNVTAGFVSCHSSAIQPAEKPVSSKGKSEEEIKTLIQSRAFRERALTVRFQVPFEIDAKTMWSSLNQLEIYQVRGDLTSAGAQKLLAKPESYLVEIEKLQASKELPEGMVLYFIETKEDEFQIRIRRKGERQKVHQSNKNGAIVAQSESTTMVEDWIVATYRLQREEN